MEKNIKRTISYIGIVLCIIVIVAYFGVVGWVFTDKPRAVESVSAPVLSTDELIDDRPPTVDDIIRLLEKIRSIDCTERLALLMDLQPLTYAERIEFVEQLEALIEVIERTSPRACLY